MVPVTGTCWFMLNKPAVHITNARAAIPIAIVIAGLEFFEGHLDLIPMSV